MSDDAARSWPELFSALLRGEHLTGADTAWAMREIMTGEATPAQLAGFAISLRAKGETAEEVNGLAATMVELANHPYFIGCQFHPEFKSRPHTPHPLFTELVRAGHEYAQVRPKTQKDKELSFN